MTKQDPKTDDPSLPTMLGAGYAHVQHLMDKAIAWGFRKMEEAKADEKPAAKPMHKAEKIGRGILSFFGAAGDAYYKTYEDLKTKDRTSPGGKA